MHVRIEKNDGTASRRAEFMNSSRGHKALWVLQIVLGADFIIGGVLKLAGVPTMVDLFDRIGAGQWLRYLVGVVEVAGGVGILVPALAGLAALGLCGLLASAAVTNVLFADDPPWVPLIWLVLVAVVAWRRWPRTRDLITGRHPTPR